MRDTDLCPHSDLRPSECDHCGAHPGNAGVRRAQRLAAARTVILDMFGYAPPGRERPKLYLGRAIDGTCACGRPTHNSAVGCEECGDEMARILGNVPWLSEQLDLTITRQRSKTIGGTGTDQAMVFNLAASDAKASLRHELVSLVRICDEERVSHSDPRGDKWPADNLPAMSGWLLWRVDGLLKSDTWTDALRTLRKAEGDVLRIVDNPPPSQFLGWCRVEFDNGQTCDGPVYAKGYAKGEEPEGSKYLVAEGKCRDCRTPYPVEASRRHLEAALDDRLCTAAELARLTTYLGLRVNREQVRKTINTWHSRGIVTPSAHDANGEPMFRYGAVRVRLAATYDTPA